MPTRVAGCPGWPREPGPAYSRGAGPGGGPRPWRDDSTSWRQPGQKRGLGERELQGRLAEVGSRGGLHAVGARAVVDLVEVQLEDLVLPQALLDSLRHHSLTDLPGECALPSHMELRRVACELL